MEFHEDIHLLHQHNTVMIFITKLCWWDADGMAEGNSSIIEFSSNKIFSMQGESSVIKSNSDNIV